MALPSPSIAGRLLLLLKSSAVSETSSSKRAKRKSTYSIGSLVQAEVSVRIFVPTSFPSHVKNILLLGHIKLFFRKTNVTLLIVKG